MEAVNYAHQPMELVRDTSIPQSSFQRQYLIDRDELIRLKEEGLIQSKLYVYLALKLTYDTSDPSIDIPWFCSQWNLKETEFSTAIAQLQKDSCAPARCPSVDIAVVLIWE